MKTFIVENKDNGTTGQIQASSKDEAIQKVLASGIRNFKIIEA